MIRIRYAKDHLDAASRQPTADVNNKLTTAESHVLTLPSCSMILHFAFSVIILTQLTKPVEDQARVLL